MRMKIPNSIRAISVGLVMFAPPSVIADQSGVAAAENATDADSDDEFSVPKLLGGSVQADELERRQKVGEFGDRFWELPILIDKPDAQFIRKFRLTGRYHGQYAYSSGSGYDGWESRRIRLGAQLDLFRHTSLQIAWRQEGDDSVFDTDSLDNNWISWRRWDAFGIKIGQQKPLWSQEWSTSSNALLTFERSLLINQLRPPHSLGVYAGGRLGRWAYGTGWFTGEKLDGSIHADGSFGLLSVAREVGDLVDFADELRWRIDYLYNRESEWDSGGGYRHALATGVSGRFGNALLTTDFVYGDGGDAVGGDVFGFTVTPAYDLVRDRLQLVLRYQFATSGGAGLRLQDRYEDPARGVEGRGDRYHALYGGLNYYLRGNQLKLMTGAEYSHMRDPGSGDSLYDGWTLLAGVRLAF